MEPSSLGSRTEALISRRFTDGVIDPFDTVEWSRRDARAGDFFMAGVEAPIDWTDASIGVVAKLYFATVDGVKETSVRQMIDRVIAKIALEGIFQGHFGEISMEEFSEIKRLKFPFHRASLDDGDEAAVFYDELVYICLHQMAGFNTPTWLNVGVPGRKQCGHACYPLSVEDKMVSDEPDGRSITDWWRTESKIFKSGGGSGINVSKIRGSMESLSTGGVASGPLPYMRTANAGAETLKSGGAHRRAAKFVCLDVDHPDVEDFIQCKVREDQHMRALAAAGINMQPFTAEGERNIAETTSFQSANHSVCVTDEFMELATSDVNETWNLKARVSDDVVATLNPSVLLREVAEAAWLCADPGLIFIDTINGMHTTPTIRGQRSLITTTNTCGEVTQNDDTACNLSAINLLKFLADDEDRSFKVGEFRHVVDVMTIAMDIVCGFSELPTDLITRNTRALRQLGMGFTNLGATIMAQGLPYDSDDGRDFAASVTALLTGRVYHQSALMAQKLGAFDLFEENHETMLGVIDKHIASGKEAYNKLEHHPVWSAAADDWVMARGMAVVSGFRNSLATAMMPTGTVSFLLGADSTGIEPVLALTTEKRLAAAGKMIMVNRSAKLAAEMLGGYSEENLKAMGEGDFSMVPPEDLPVFATALGSNTIEPMGHVRMVAAIQPFVSQAISKTTNLPNSATVEDILEVYTEAWRMGVKVLSVYRDGSKSTQVLSAVERKVAAKLVGDAGTSGGPMSGPRPPKVHADEVEMMDPDVYAEAMSLERAVAEPYRRRMPRTRRMVGHKIHVRSAMGEHEGYVIAGVHDDGDLGEVFIEGFGKQGSFTQNALSAWATDLSIALQYGVPMEVLCRKHAFVSDETGGLVVPDPQGTPLALRECRSIVDYIARWLVAEFGDVDLQEELGVMTDEVKKRKTTMLDAKVDLKDVAVEQRDGVSVVTAATVAAVNLVPKPWVGDLVGNGHGRTVDIGMPCGGCGGTMRRTGSCWTCTTCGTTSGCA